jgi:hypothetical protein
MLLGHIKIKQIKILSVHLLSVLKEINTGVCSLVWGSLRAKDSKVIKKVVLVGPLPLPFTDRQ